MKAEPSRAAAREWRNKRMLGDSYDIPYFEDSQMGKDPRLRRKVAYLRIEEAEFRDLLEISRLSKQFKTEIEAKRPEGKDSDQ